MSATRTLFAAFLAGVRRVDTVAPWLRASRRLAVGRALDENTLTTVHRAAI